jgi:glutamate/tyrosine decarboxylase-like PLP-dependent enzyme
MDPKTASLLAAAQAHAAAYLDGLPERPVPASATADELVDVFGGPVPAGPVDPAAVLERLVAIADSGLTATSSPRFFGFVVGGTYPVALAADWLTTVWDQNAGLREVTPAHSAAREAVQAWVVDLLGLPSGSTMGTVTGGTMANFTGLAAARHAVLARAGWDVEERGLQGAARVRVLVGQERHDTVDLALRYLGLGAPEAVPADEQGRIRVDALATALQAGDGPTIVALQAGNVHSGAFDDFAAAVPLAHEHGAWVHVDGAFGLWAAACPATAHLTAGMALADSWATDAHKTLNVPYDSGLIIVADQTVHRAALGIHAPYLIHSLGAPDPLELGPEFSQRGRAFPLWAVLASLGRSGVADLVGGLARHAAAFADGVRDLGGEVLNDVVFTQVCTAWGDDATTVAVERRLLADGQTWMTGSQWRGRRVLRIAVSNHATTDADVARSLAALGAAVRAVR